MSSHCIRVPRGGRSLEEEISWKPFLRQLLVCSGVLTSYFIYGLLAGAPTVFIPQIRREANSTEVISAEMASWLNSVVGFSGFPCVIILSILTRFIGRKISFIISCINAFTAYLLFYCSNTVFQILISEILQGFSAAAQMVVAILILTEYISPKYRGLFLTLKCATFYWGIWVSNAIGTFFHWKNIGLLGMLGAAYSVVTIIIWPESPYWLASKGRYEECATSHRWLKGCDEDSEEELKSLINTQKAYIKSNKDGRISMSQKLKNFYVSVTAKEFYKPTLLSVLTGCLSVTCGKMICAIYAIDILMKITGSDATAYTGMLILDGVTVASMYVGCVISKFVKRRTMLLVATSIGIMVLFIFSLYLYLISLSIISENSYVTVSLLILFSISMGCGPLIMSLTIYGELIPIRSRNLAICILSVVGKISVGVSLKVAPYSFKAFGMHGTFFSFGASSAVIIMLLYKYLPETKDKTLQEITDTIGGIKPRNIANEETSKLVVPTILSSTEK